MSSRNRPSARERAQAICDGCGNKKAQCACLEAHLLRDILAVGLPEPQKEFTFALPERAFRADFAYPEHKVLIECEGGGAIGHHQNDRYEYDCRRYNIASAKGWKVLRFTGRMIRSGEAVATIESVLRGEVPQGTDRDTSGTEGA